ncbi:MAG: DUF378 domain-containing protein [Candidatus Pacearchaeota archaeon]|jgi:hypothetical protein
MAKSVLDWIALVLLIIGGLNWGLIAINQSWDLVLMISGGTYNLFAQIIYGLVGISALYTIYYLFKK